MRYYHVLSVCEQYGATTNLIDLTKESEQRWEQMYKRPMLLEKEIVLAAFGGAGATAQRQHHAEAKQRAIDILQLYVFQYPNEKDSKVFAQYLHKIGEKADKT